LGIKSYEIAIVRLKKKKLKTASFIFCSSSKSLLPSSPPSIEFPPQVCNPIINIHDQGAGGNCNVVKEIIYPKGAEIDIKAIVVGDHMMSVLEI
jgi:hypothetical protein